MLGHGITKSFLRKLRFFVHSCNSSFAVELYTLFGTLDWSRCSALCHSWTVPKCRFIQGFVKCMAASRLCLLRSMLCFGQMGRVFCLLLPRPKLARHCPDCGAIGLLMRSVWRCIAKVKSSHMSLLAVHTERRWSLYLNSAGQAASCDQSKSDDSQLHTRRPGYARDSLRAGEGAKPQGQCFGQAARRCKSKVKHLANAAISLAPHLTPLPRSPSMGVTCSEITSLRAYISLERPCASSW